MKKILVTILLIAGSIPAFAQLPQNHSWEVTLRNYMKTLTTSDFQVAIKSFSYNSSWTTSNDTLYHWWLAMNALPSEKEILMDPKYLLLSSIEGSDGKIHMRIGRGYYSVLGAAWWADFNYPGNPYYNNKAIKLRALIPAMVDMMMLTQAHEAGQYTRSDFAGGNLLMYAYAFYVGKDALPDNVQQAYATGMLSMMQDISKWGPTGIFGDMDGFAAVGMWYAAKALNSPTVTQEAENYTDRLIKRWFFNAGYMGHGNGYDPAYDGIDLYFYSWAERISGYQPLKKVLNKVLYLKEYLTVPDPDGYWNGPSHWATATSAPVSGDLWGGYERDVSDAMISDHALPLVLGNGVNLYNAHQQQLRAIPPDRSFMQQGQPRNISIIDYLNNRNQIQSNDEGFVPSIWGQGHWVETIPVIYMYDGYKPGFYNKLISLKNNNSPLLQAAFSRKGNFIKIFSNNVNYPDSCTFVSTKLGGYGAIIHTGRLSNWGGATGVLSGLSGGALSTFWTPSTGAVINGVAGGYQNNNKDQQDTWNDWQEWSVNTISGVNGNGKPFSAARDRFPKAKSTVAGDSTSATVIATGQIGSNIDGGRTAPNGAIQGKVDYNRKFDINPSGVTITSTISSDGADKIKELWEMIPVFLKQIGDNSSTAITLQINNGKWVSATSSLTQDVTAIQLKRFSGAVNITFTNPQSVKLSGIRTLTYQVGVSTQNIMIDLLHSNGSTVAFPKQTSVTYTIAPSVEKSTPVDQSGSNLPNKIELKQNYPNPFNPTTNITFQLASTTPVTLQIFDILGRLVSSPIRNRVMNAGEHHIQFNGSNLASGVYIYRLKTSNTTLDKKMMLIK